MPDQSTLIDSLTADLAPVRPLRPRTGLALAGMATIVTMAALVLILGIAPQVAGARPSSHMLIVNGLLLVLGICAAAGVVAMASPSVGPRNEGPKWALGMAAIMPLVALFLLAGEADAHSALDPEHGWHCAAIGTASAVLVAATLVLWLRRGAPVSLTRAGFYTGVASGALGSVSYALSCPFDSIYHLGIWHFVPVVAWGVVGRWAVPLLIRW